VNGHYACTAGALEFRFPITIDDQLPKGRAVHLWLSLPFSLYADFQRLAWVAEALVSEDCRTSRNRGTKLPTSSGRSGQTSQFALDHEPES
jgi:hypothetical protein